MKEASSSWEQFLDDRQQGNGALSPTTNYKELNSTNTRMSFEVDFLPEPADKNLAYMTLWF